MKLKLIIPILLCISLLAMPAAAEEFAPADKSNEHNQSGHIYVGSGIYFTKAEIKDAAVEIWALLNDHTLSSSDRLNKYPENFGYDARLHHYMNNETVTEADIQEEGGNPFFDWIGGIIDKIFTIFAGKPVEIENPYNETEGDEAWNNYLASYYAGYKASGEFGGPIQ